MDMSSSALHGAIEQHEWFTKDDGFPASLQVKSSRSSSTRSGSPRCDDPFTRMCHANKTRSFVTLAKTFFASSRAGKSARVVNHELLVRVSYSGRAKATKAGTDAGRWVNDMLAENATVTPGSSA